jgi:hypothetical protein
MPTEPAKPEIDSLIKDLLATKSKQELALIWLVLGEGLATNSPDEFANLITSVLQENIQIPSSHASLAMVLMKSFEDFVLSPALLQELNPEEIVVYANIIGEA